MIKKILLLCCCILTIAIAGYAQGQRITGRVLSARDEQALPGVSVTIKGTSNTVTTNGNGEFSIAAPTGSGATLVFTFVGHERKEVNVSASERNLQVILGERYEQLDSWSMYLITAFKDAEKFIGRKADRNRKIYNGMMKTYFYQFMGPKPPKKNTEGLSE